MRTDRACIPLLALALCVTAGCASSDAGAGEGADASGASVADASRDGDATPDRPPNLVFIMVDDLGWGELGCYGQTRIATPNIDRLAREGTRFTTAYAGSPVCAPSRCVLLTGLHGGHAVVRDNREMGGWAEGDPEGQMPLPPGTTTIGTLLQARGYVTACIGKWGLGGPGSSGEPNAQGFDHFFGHLCQRIAHNQYPTHLWRDGERVELPGNTWGNVVGETYAHDLMADDALRFVDEHADVPFFLDLSFHLPHLALQAPDDELLARYEGAFDDPPYDGGKGYLPNAHPRATYAAMVSRIDRDVGRLLERLAALGLDDDTLVLFTSDNGPTYDVGGADSDFFASAGTLRGRKGSVYEGGLRVPLLARWPGHVPAGRVTDVVASFPDVLPTLVELAGGAPPAGGDGISLAPTLLGVPGQRARSHVYVEFPGYGGQQMLRFGDWSAVRRDLAKGNTRVELYDLAVDPDQRHDVADAHPDVVARALEVMRVEHVPSAEFPLKGVDE
ncbi:MAG: arylsulfatase [Planctomycetes bacterium]|nr:arylsulfatase [Planctomycetota bacterium]